MLGIISEQYKMDYVATFIELLEGGQKISKIGKLSISAGDECSVEKLIGEGDTVYVGIDIAVLGWLGKAVLRR